MRSAFVDLASQPVQNLALNPSAENDITYWGRNQSQQVVMTDGGAPGCGQAYCRQTTTLTGDTTIQAGGFVNSIPLQPGQIYTFSAWVRSNVAMPLRISLEIYDISHTRLSNFRAPVVTLVPNVWTRLSYTTSAVDATAVTGTCTCYSSGYAWGSGDYLDVDGVMVTPGTALYPYADGDTPGWKWTGAAGASTSVGYPYTLEAIAGVPAWSSTVPSGYPNVAPPPDPFSARTLYVVMDVLTTADSWSAALMAASSTVSLGSLRFQTSAPGDPKMGFRLDTPGGSTNVSPGLMSGVRTVGRHVGMVQVNSGITTMRGTYDGNAILSTAAIPGNGLAGGDMLMTGSAGNELPVFGAQYFAYHDDVTAFRIMAWLARQYGAPIPAGY